MEPEYKIVESWLKVDLVHWGAGALAGSAAAILAAIVGGFISLLGGYELVFPFKLFAGLFLGPTALAYDSGFLSIFVGIAFLTLLGAFLGFVFSHFTRTNNIKALIPMGCVWGIFSWIFIWNLFLPSFQTFYAVHLPSGPAFLVCVLFGALLAMTSKLDALLRRIF